MNNISENIHFLKTLELSSQTEFVRFVVAAKRGRLLSLCEVLHNVMKGAIEVSEQEDKVLKRHRKTIRKFCMKKLSARDKKEILKKHAFLIHSILQKYMPQVEAALEEWKKVNKK